MGAGEILSVDLQECGGGVHEHELVIRRWLDMDGANISENERSHALQDAFGMSFEADEALNIVHADLFGSIIRE